jgi:hypothetical protein
MLRLKIKLLGHAAYFSAIVAFQKMDLLLSGKEKVSFVWMVLI